MIFFQIFDFGDIVTLCMDESRRVGNQYVLLSTKSIHAYEDIYLCDHLWTFADKNAAKKEIQEVGALRERLRALLELR